MYMCIRVCVCVVLCLSFSLSKGMSAGERKTGRQPAELPESLPNPQPPTATADTTRKREDPSTTVGTIEERQRGAALSHPQSQSQS
mmetsp:Transcript_25180/g.28240  ORF Transcript_25180/g.28240 Transcript_25180/m.28240 type:complete len:86 (-) Transcript_25180:508-765(-)